MTGRRAGMYAALLVACASNASMGQATPGPEGPDVLEARLARYSGILGGRLASDSSQRVTAARITLPGRAAQPVVLEDTRSRVALALNVEGALDVPLTSRGGLAFAADALGPEVDLVYRSTAGGVEDFQLYPSRPPSEIARYRIELSGASGLRLVARTLELLDAGGAPRLRMSAPYLLDAGGARHEADFDVLGCDVDRDPRPPWGRPVTPPRATSCTIELRWDGRDIAYPAVLDPAWTTTNSTAYEHDYGWPSSAMDLLSDGHALIAGGYDGVGQVSAELFDPATETWATTGSLSQGIGEGSMTALAGGRALFVGDYSTGAEVYDAATGKWTALTLAANDANTSTRLLDGRVLVLGGLAAQVFDPVTDTLTRVKDMSTKRGVPCAAVLPNGKVLVAGGWGSGSSLRTTEIFDPVSGDWSPGPDMAVGRGGHTCTRMPSGAVLVAGGGDDRAGVMTAEIYDPAAGIFKPGGTFSAPHNQHGASVSGNGVLVTGGSWGVLEKATELYDPASGEWLPAGQMKDAHVWQAQLTLPSGDIVVAGGYAGYHPYKGVEVFHPLAAGTACTQDGECPTGHCTDGVCCNQACKAACYACSAAKKGGGADGVCGPIAAGPDPAGRCRMLPETTCATNGLCNGAGACSFHPKGTVCATRACAAGTLSESSCDGEGLCVPTTTSCAGFACASDASCKVAPCAEDADCAPGFACASGACAPRKPECDGDHTLVGVDGSRIDCAPYRCAASECLSRCNSATQCDEAHVCNRLGACVLPEEAERAADEAFLGGCRIGRASGGAPVPLAPIAIAVALRRRRRGRRAS